MPAHETAVRPAKTTVHYNPSINQPDRAQLRQVLERRPADVSIAVSEGWSLAWERAQWQRSRPASLSIRLFPDEVQVGPLWVQRTGSGCAGCAEWRSRLVGSHPLKGRLEEPRHAPFRGSPSRLTWLYVAMEAIAVQPLAPGELIAVGARGTGRHRILRSANCPICAESLTDPSLPPPELTFEHVRALPGDPLRAAPRVLRLTREALRKRLLDARFGPIVQIQRDTQAPFAMSNAVMPGSPAMGYGRADTYGAAEPTAILEAYERLAAKPVPGLILMDTPYTAIADHAVPPAALGYYTEEQLSHPLCRVLPSDATTRMDWAWGHFLHSREPVLVPAEIAFYLYTHQTPPGAARKRRYYDDCSNGCALGGSITEATLHGLRELQERDAFLLAWHREAPLAQINPASLDEVSRRLLDLIESRGFDAHVLITTADIDMPAVWVLAIRRDGRYPASYNSAGADPDPAKAINGALWEVTQQLCEKPRWTREDIEPMAEDPWLVADIDDHIGLYTLPAMLPRLTKLLGGPLVSLDEAFPGWPGCFYDEAGGNIHGALELVAERFRRAGLDQIIVVDQSTRDHRDLGLHAVKVIVPGAVPLTFGHASQRMLGISRLTRAVPPGRVGDMPYDPHPFP